MGVGIMFRGLVTEGFTEEIMIGVGKVCSPAEGTTCAKPQKHGLFGQSQILGEELWA